MDSGSNALIPGDDAAVADGVLDLLLAEFITRVEPLGVRVARVPTAAEAGGLIALWAAELGTDSAVVAGEAAQRYPGAVSALAEAGVAIAPLAAPDIVRDAPLGVSLAHLAVAETGSLLLAEPTLEDRAVGMLTLAQVILCPTATLVPSLDEAGAALRQIALTSGASFATLVTGPSRTADIERVLTVGVQGPGKVMAIFIDE
ncbi:MAG: LUD domain-containing protein [Thermomicrobiales bacterium]